jgi:hypothetical protein
MKERLATGRSFLFPGHESDDNPGESGPGVEACKVQHVFGISSDFEAQ